MSVPGAAVIVALLLSAPTVAQAQDAAARLRRIVQADVDAPMGFAERRVCLSPGAYVLVTVAADPEREAVALVSEQAVAREGNSGPVAGVVSRTEMAWQPFMVTDHNPACYTVTVVDGRARLYSLTVGVDW